MGREGKKKEKKNQNKELKKKKIKSKPKPKKPAQLYFCTSSPLHLFHIPEMLLSAYLKQFQLLDVLFLFKFLGKLKSETQ